jgi:hypothetical protein
MSDPRAECAQTILAQLGGNKFIAMTGARDLVSLGDGLQATLPASLTRRQVNRLLVRLDRGTDTYTVSVFKFTLARGQTAETTRELVHAGDLRRVFTELTGLDTHL